VLDRIVPGYYHRLDEAGSIATSTCCQNTATEHAMMGKLMIDSVVTWAKEYKVDGFRFDLMGHHSKQNLLDVRAALDELTLAADGVDGSQIYLYGEGWNFGEVADNARFVQATQLEMAGTGVGTFSDRLRDAVRGGGPFDGGTALVTNQGFVNGLWYDPNEQAMPEGDALAELLLSADQIRVGMAGNLADYTFVDRTGASVTGSQVDYNGAPAGYTADPQENIVYIAAHDNQTLFDIGQYHHPLTTSTADRVRAQNVGNSIVALAQGVPFLHAGQDLLRSKSMDRDSYNSGDWFNRLDLTYQTNNWGVGVPIQDVNGDNWPLIEPRLRNLPAPQPDDIAFATAVTQEWFRIRTSSPLFRLETAAEIQDRLTFANTGPSQTPGLIVMSIRDDVDGLADLDPMWEGVEVLVNATDEPVSHTDPSRVGAPVELHPVLVGSVDDVVRSATFDPATGTFSIPARTTAVFVDLGPDLTPPVGTAELVEIEQHGNWGRYRVEVTCTDDRGDATGTATVNGVAVEDGDIVTLIDHPHRSSWVRTEDGTFIWGATFELTVTCTDGSGNTSTTSTTLDIVDRGRPPGAT
jgi:pullulanase-type alpha-1,6-glucosidase